MPKEEKGREEGKGLEHSLQAKHFPISNKIKLLKVDSIEGIERFHGGESQLSIHSSCTTQLSTAGGGEGRRRGRESRNRRDQTHQPTQLDAMSLSFVCSSVHVVSSHDNKIDCMERNRHTDSQHEPKELFH